MQKKDTKGGRNRQDPMGIFQHKKRQHQTEAIEILTENHRMEKERKWQKYGVGYVHQGRGL